MTLDNYLNPVRIYWLIKKDISKNWKVYLITIGAFFGFYLLAEIIGAKTETLDPSMHRGFLANLIFVVGIIATASAFRESHKKLKNHEWLMLPASTLEKFVSRLLMHTVVFLLLTLVLYFLFSLLSLLVVRVILGEPFPMFNPFDTFIWKVMGHYIIIQSVFVLGAAWFKSHNLIKTVLAIAVISISISILGSLVGWLVFNDYFWILMRGHFDFNITMADGFDSARLESLIGSLALFSKILYFGLLAPVCWFGSWLKLRELEVSDGV